MSNPFSNWTQADVERHNAKRKPEMKPVHVGGDVCAERLLHNRILDECERRGWIALHGSMAHRAYRTVGEFDFTILADRGRSFYLECKTRTGKLTNEQLGLNHWARNLGHSAHVIRSFKEFLEITK